MPTPNATSDEAPFRATAFVLRTPRMPFDCLINWGHGLGAPTAHRSGTGTLKAALDEDRRLLRERLRALAGDAGIREALLLASASLHDEGAPGDSGEPSPGGKRKRKVERALVRYVSRMAARPTPFGLMAACAIGQIGPQSRLDLVDATALRRTRIDAGVLYELTGALNRERPLREALKFRTNSSLYLTAGRYRVMVATDRGRVRMYHLVGFEPSAELEAIVMRGRSAGTFEEFVQELVSRGNDRDDAAQFVHELIDNQVLVSTLGVVTYGEDPLTAAVEVLHEAGGAPVVVSVLRDVKDCLEALDRADRPADYEAKYRHVSAQVKSLGPDVPISRLFHVDFGLRVPSLILGTEVVAVAADIIPKLASVVPRRDNLSEFREAFEERYGQQQVPILEALDNEVGIGLVGRRATSSRRGPGGGAADHWRMRRLAGTLQAGSPEIELNDLDWEKLKRKDHAELPDTFTVNAKISAKSTSALEAGEFRLFVKGAWAPATNVLGRFCQLEPGIASAVDELVAREQALRPDVVFAEVVHQPGGRVTNIIHRPSMRSHRIEFLALAVSDDEVIYPEDLYVSVLGDRVILRSRKLDKEVVPRLSCAHGFSRPTNLPLYRFLGELQHQRAGAFGWDWGVCNGLPYLPRVTSGRSVVSLARWMLDATDIGRLKSLEPDHQYEAMQALRIERGIPRFVRFVEGDNAMPVDIDNALSVEMLVDLLDGDLGATLVEEFPPPGESPVSGIGGQYSHEVLIPFVRTATVESPVRWHAPVQVHTHPSRQRPHRSFIPGSEWLFMKFYMGVSAVDMCLVAHVGPLIERLLREGHVALWHYLRYADPGPHLRVRVKGDPETLGRVVLPAFQQVARDLHNKGIMWRFQLDSYEREVERYGGPSAMEVAEEVFHVDSTAALEVLRAYPGDEGLARRTTHVCLRGVDTLLNAFGVDEDAAKVRVYRVFAAYQESQRKKVGEAFRQRRKEVEEALSRHAPQAGPPEIAVFGRRTLQLQGAVTRLFELEASSRLAAPWVGVLASLAHMHANRLLRAPFAQQHEREMYACLMKHYESLVARNRGRTSATVDLPGRPRPAEQ